MRPAFDTSIEFAARPLRGLRVLLYGFSGIGFPGGDGAIEASRVLPACGVDAIYTHELDPQLLPKLARDYDVAIICNTRIARLLQAPERLWSCAPVRALWFWDLRPASAGAALRGRVDRVFLTYNGAWTSPEGNVYDPSEWARTVAPVGYCPQASPLRTPIRDDLDAARVVFVGDLGNRTYHQGRFELCRDLGAQVVNARARDDRLAVEAKMPRLYGSSRFCLSTSPLAPGYTSVRTYSIIACGGLLVLHRFPGCERLFADGENAILFDSAEDLIPKLEQYDIEPATRARIATAGHELHARNHTVAHRVLTICRELIT
jgi:hypothetical protein